MKLIKPGDKIADFSFANVSPKALVQAGYAGAIGYGGPNFNNKNLTPNRCKSLFDYGLGVTGVFEVTATRPLKPQLGYDDGVYMRDQYMHMGFPETYRLYWAVDFDTTVLTAPLVTEYGNHFRDGCGNARPYGDSECLNRQPSGGWLMASRSFSKEPLRVAIDFEQTTEITGLPPGQIDKNYCRTSLLLWDGVNEVTPTDIDTGTWDSLVWTCLAGDSYASISARLKQMGIVINPEDIRGLNDGPAFLGAGNRLSIARLVPQPDGTWVFLG